MEEYRLHVQNKYDEYLIKTENRMVCEYFGCYSQTTTRHQKEFFRQVGLFDRQIKELWLNGGLEISDFDE